MPRNISTSSIGSRHAQLAHPSVAWLPPNCVTFCRGSPLSVWNEARSGGLYVSVGPVTSNTAPVAALLPIFHAAEQLYCSFRAATLMYGPGGKAEGTARGAGEGRRGDGWK